MCVVFALCTLAATTSHAAIVERVQSGTVVNTNDGTQTITIAAIDPARSFLLFQTRHSSNRPSSALIRGQIASATTIQFVRNTNEANPPDATIQWYVVTFGTGVTVQRGTTTQTAATFDIGITPVASMSQAFVIWSKTGGRTDTSWSSTEHAWVDLTSTSNLRVRSNASGNHVYAWQVVEFTNPADIDVQRGFVTSMTGTATSATATLGTAVDPAKTFVLAAFRSSGSGNDIGARMLRAQVTNATTVTIDRSISGSPDDITEIAWQAVQLKDGSRIWQGSESFAAGAAQKNVTLDIPQVNPTRAVAFGSVEMGGGQSAGRTPYAGDDNIGVCSVTADFTPTVLTLTRANTAAACDVGWFVVQFAGSTGFKAGSFTKSIFTGNQSVEHGLGETPKALILWTTNQAPACGAGGITFKGASAAGANAGITSLTIDKPSATAAGDAMFAAIALRPETGTVTPPAGWLLLTPKINNTNATAHSLSLYGKIADTTEPASYTWTFSGTPTGSSGGIQVYCGVDTANPIDAMASQLTPRGLTHSAPSITTTVPNALVVTTHVYSSAGSWTPPAGMTEAYDTSSMASGNGITTIGSYAIQAAAGNTGQKTATASTDPDVGIAHIMALRPASAPSGMTFAFGMTDGTTSRSASTSSLDNGGTTRAARRMSATPLTIVRWDQALLAEADFVSWDATHLTLNWTTNDAVPGIVHYMAIGGSDVSAKVLDWITPTGPGDLVVTGVGFQPSVVLHAHAGGGFTTALPSTSQHGAFGLGAMDFDGDQWGNAILTVDNAGTSDTQRGQQTDAAFYALVNNLTVSKEASWKSMDADGFTMSFSTSNGTAARAFSLALKGVNVKPGSFNKSTGSAPAAQAVTGTDFQPEVVLLTSTQATTQAVPTPHSRIGLGASDSMTPGSSALHDQDGLDVSSVDAFDSTSKVFVKVDNDTATVDAEAGLASLDPDGFTLNWTTNDAAATEILYLAMAPLNATAVRLTSLAAHRYDRGVLVQWRTGYEIDNLGFHVYREANGERTRITPALVAGSGLQAGRGKAVNAELGYAWWDLGAPAEGVAYWLEDVDFDGTSTFHGPVTPVEGGLQDVEASVLLGDPALPRKGKTLLFTSMGADAGGATAAAVRRAASAPEIATQWAIAAAASIKIGVVKPGWYRVSQPQLVAAGLDPSVDPRRLRLYVDGLEQAMLVTGEGDGRLDPADAIEFYGSGLDTPHTSTRVYWLAAGEGPGRRIANAGSTPAAASPETSFRLTRQLKERSIYFAALRNGDAENWFGSFVSEFFPTELTLDVSNVSTAAPGTARIEVVLQGVGATPGVDPDHRVGVLVNGTEVGEMRFDGQALAAQAFDVPHAILREGANAVELKARGGEPDTSLVEAVRLSYWHPYRADADLLRFTAEGQRTVTVDGFSTAAIRVVDVTDPAQPIELAGTASADDLGLHAVTVAAPGSGVRTLVAFTDATVGTPATVRANGASAWHDRANAADYVIVTHGNFAATMRRLADLRRAQGHSVAIVDIEDVYDEFHYGERAPLALRQFLTWARTQWKTAPRFVVLGGDATVDPRDYAGFGDADFVPTKQVPMTAAELETASDDWFADSDDDGMPEMAIGRLPVRTPAQAEAMIAKLEAYDAAPAASWMQDVTLVADDDDRTTGFEAASSALAAALPSGYRPRTVFRRVVGGDAARTEIATAASDGQLLINYIGHGSTRVWGGHADLLTDADVAGWRNEGRLPFVVAMNCLNGFFHGIYDEASLAETMLRMPDAGAVGVWASSSTTPSSTQALVNQEFVRLLFAGTHQTVGEAAAAAKRVVDDLDLRRSWIYFGDPALRLRGIAYVAPPPPPTPVSLPATPPPAPAPGAPGSGDDAGRVRSVRLVDFNGDLRDDVWMYAQESGAWSVAFGGASEFRYRHGAWEPAWETLVARLNQDDLPDFLMRNRETGQWRQAFNGGDARLAVLDGTGPAGGQLAAGDFTGDGIDEALVYDPKTGAWALLSAGESGGFEQTRAGSWDKAAAVHLADLDGDGRADALGYDPVNGHGFVAMNTGNGAFNVTRPGWGKSWEIAFANLDGDRAADVLFYNPFAGGWLSALNAGDGRFAYRTGTWPAGMRPHLADLDGDGRDDVFAYDAATGAWIVGMNDGRGGFVEHPGAFAPHWSVATGDMDGDGRGDVLLYDPVTGNWFQCLMLDPGVFRYVSGTWVPDSVLLGLQRREFGASPPKPPAPVPPGPPSPGPKAPSKPRPGGGPQAPPPTPPGGNGPAEPPAQPPVEPPAPPPEEGAGGAEKPKENPGRGRRKDDDERGKPISSAKPRESRATPRPPAAPGATTPAAPPPRKAIPRSQGTQG